MSSYREERDALRKQFGERLRELRAAKFGSQEAMALEGKLNRVHISYIETGRRSPELETLLILAETLEVSVQELVEGLSAPKQRRRTAKQRS